MTYWERWAKRRNRPGNPQAFSSHNLYILPSGFGWAYGLVVAALFLGAINSQIGSIFFMTFLLAMVGLLSAFETHENLKGIRLELISIEDAQEGTPVKLTFFIQGNKKTRFSIDFGVGFQPKTRLEKIPAEGLQFILTFKAERRGYFPLPRITITSSAPFGIFRVWSYAYFDENYYVYPQPVNPGFWPAPCQDQDIKMKTVAGDEEFYDLKLIENPWAQPNLIAWRIAAKGQGWFLKTMNSYQADYWQFKLKELPAQDLESKLQNLSYWLQEAELNGLIYSLELKGVPTRFAQGKEHLQACLRQLALCQ